MKWIDLTLPSPEENLACDEALLDHCEEGAEGGILRFWEPTAYFVVLGYSNRWSTEVDASACAERGIPIFRRCSGGGTVLQGPGCLNYSLILKIEDTVTGSNRAVLERNAAALAPLLPEPPRIQGHTDLTLGPFKFSGNSQRRRRHFMLMHGTILVGMDLDLVEKCLPFPTLQPDYRRNRSHRDFIRNVNLKPAEVKNALKREWKAESRLTQIPDERIANLAALYATAAWNKKF